MFPHFLGEFESDDATTTDMAGTFQGDEPFLEGSCGNPGISSRVALVVAYSGPGDGDLMGTLSSSRAHERITQFVGATYGEAPDQ